ncbi:MAG: phosphoribosylformylglycinamidine synthase subunit PurL [Candidatus Eremiobacteraeota bacterium]|nr:phosphoribosylformylglycinamidine synthase subunit PurL [Candidatus Eremiobacteraeota bacterium]
MGNGIEVAGSTDEALRLQARRAGVALRPDELRRIAQRLHREPTTVELHAFDAQWSEHCSYKSSRHFLHLLPTAGPAVVLGPSEDSGIVHLGTHDGERYGIVIAHESHNHPSQVVPFEGAATGIGGIVRDVVCMGAEVIALADPLRFGRIEPGSHQRYVAQSAVDGISAYGNAIGVPNLAGDAYFDEGFDDNCLVNVVALGLVKESEIIHSYAPAGAGGWDIVLVGKATDASGFGGASFSSVTLDAADEESNKGAVQVPDPFLKNVIMRASYRVFALLREKQCRAGFKDLGAGGIMGCSAEICSSGGYGACIDLDAVNVALDGLLPEVVAIGETQERFIWVLPPDITADVLRIYNHEYTLPEIARNARASVIGTVTPERRYVLRSGGSIVMDVDIDFLTGTIRDELPYRDVVPAARHDAGPLQTEMPLEELLDAVLKHRDVCSREPLYRRYDAAVRGRTVVARGEGDAGVLAPIFGSRLGVALSVAGNPRYGRIDPRLAAEHAVYESVRAVLAVGARPVALTDCLNFGNPRKEEHLSELVASVEGLAHAAGQFGTPFVSGNVSLYNESAAGTPVPASAIVACVGSFDDISTVVTMALKRRDGALYLIGNVQAALGGSVAAEIAALEGGALPSIDYQGSKLHHAFLFKAMQAWLVRSAHGIANGGSIVAVCEMAFAALRRGGEPVGARLDDTRRWSSESAGEIESLFGEWGGFIAEVAGEDVDAFERLADGIEGVRRIGTTIDRPVIVMRDREIDLQRLFDLWMRPLAEVYP